MTKQLHLESAVGIYFRRGQTESFKAFMPMETLHPKKKWGRRRRLCEAKCLTQLFYICHFVKSLNEMSF